LRVSAAIACGVVETMRQAAKARPAKLSLVMGSYAFSTPERVRPPITSTATPAGHLVEHLFNDRRARFSRCANFLDAPD
jgi:hypothetical protein